MAGISHEEQHHNFPPGTPVIAADGQHLGTVHEVYEHFILVRPEGAHGELEVPPHAVTDYDGTRITLSVNREALSVVDDEESASRRLNATDS